MNELKPCPFCGSIPDVEPWHGGAISKISCTNELCPATPSTIGRNKTEAINLWNTKIGVINVI